ncbi:hypothetical protein C8Q80DRAFT_1118584 [Daedaleopsis nitida]|nr:hypothetical protein C8Q80DRAFT_1118584 [Daedaleopsis nitida]
MFFNVKVAVIAALAVTASGVSASVRTPRPPTPAIVTSTVTGEPVTTTITIHSSTTPVATGARISFISTVISTTTTVTRQAFTMITQTDMVYCSNRDADSGCLARRALHNQPR